MGKILRNISAMMGTGAIQTTSKGKRLLISANLHSQHEINKGIETLPYLPSLRDIIEETLWMLKGGRTIDTLPERIQALHAPNIVDLESIERDVGITIGSLWRSSHTYLTDKGELDTFDQLDNVIKLLSVRALDQPITLNTISPTLRPFPEYWPQYNHSVGKCNQAMFEGITTFTLRRPTALERMQEGVRDCPYTYPKPKPYVLDASTYYLRGDYLHTAPRYSVIHQILMIVIADLIGATPGTLSFTVGSAHIDYSALSDPEHKSPESTKNTVTTVTLVDRPRATLSDFTIDDFILTP